MTQYCVRWCSGREEQSRGITPLKEEQGGEGDYVRKERKNLQGRNEINVLFKPTMRKCKNVYVNWSKRKNQVK